MIACQTKTKVSKVTVTGGAYQATFLNPSRQTYTCTQFDGCVVRNSIAADFVITKKPTGDLVVELKGRGVEHAVDQVMETAKYLNDNGFRTGKLAGLVVCRQYPKERSKVQRLQLAFAKRFKSPLHVQTGNREYVFEDLFSS